MYKKTMCTILLLSAYNITHAVREDQDPIVYDLRYQLQLTKEGLSFFERPRATTRETLARIRTVLDIQQEVFLPLMKKPINWSELRTPLPSAPYDEDNLASMLMAARANARIIQIHLRNAIIRSTT